MRTYIEFVLRHRVPVLCVCVIMTILAGLSISRVVMASSLAEMILGDSDAYRQYEQLVTNFGSDESLIVAMEDPPLATIADVERLERIIDRIDGMERVARVESPLDFDFQEGRPPDLAALADHPVAGGLLVSRDGRHIALLIEMQPERRMALEQTPIVVQAIIDVFAAEGIDPSTLHLGGLTATLATVAQETRLNVLRLMPFMAVLLLGTVYLLFRRLWPAFIALAVGSVAVIWTMGFAIQLDRQLDVLLALGPALILLITFSDVVHLCSAYMLEISAGRPREEAVRRSAADVGVACLCTSLTTAIGFLGLSLVNVPAFRRFGIVAGFGVAAALLLAMTLVPIILSYAKPPKPWRTDRLRWLDRMLGAMRVAAMNRPWIVIGGFVVVLAVSAIGIARIEIETNLTTRFSETSRYRQDVEWIDRQFAGTNTLEIFLHWPEDVEVDNRALPVNLARFADELASWEGISRTLSVVDVARSMVDLNDLDQRALTDAEIARLSPGLLAVDEPRLRRLVDHDNRRMRFVAFLTETGMAATFDLGERATAAAEEILGPGVEVEASGLAYLAGGWIDENVRSQRRAVIVSFVMISLVLMILFSSIRLGLWSMFPNVVPLAVLGGVLGFVFRFTDSDLALVALIAIGIAVDDTIHFLCRATIERRRAGTDAQAVERTFTSAGRAIAMTSIIFAVGFAPFATSSYLTIRLLGVLLPMTMIVAMIADLLLLPALVRVGAIRLAEATKPRSDEATEG